MSGLKGLNMIANKSSKPLNTLKIKIKAAVPIDIPKIEIPVIIFIELVDFFPNKYLLAMLIDNLDIN